MRGLSTGDTLGGDRQNDPLAPRSILVVEHEALVTSDIQSSLMRFGYDVPTAACSSAEALEAVETYHPDLVVIEVGSENGQDGIAAAAAIRSRHPTPIILVSSESDEATLIRAQQEAQPNGYLLRPYQDSELRAAVEVALQRHTLDQETSQQRSLLAGVLGAISDAVVAADRDGRVVLVNEAGRRAFGDTPSVDEPSTEGATILLGDEVTLCPADELPLVRALRGEMVRDVELFIQTAQYPEGRRYSVNATPLRDADGIVCGAVAVGRDLTDQRAAHCELRQLAQTDALTGAYNRWGFMQVARNALESAHQSGRKPAVFFIDLNGMKRINDSLGHLQGDQLLSDVMTILRECFRPSDVIGRLGGDEFVVLSPDAGESAELFRARLRVAVDEHNARSERSYRVSISVGVATEDQQGPAGLEDLVEQADKRMYEDKVRRRSRRPGDTLPPPGDG